MSGLPEIEAFAMVVAVGSFSGAAKRLGISTSYASKLVTRLEDRLSVRLLHRTTRRLTLTDAGAIYYERCRKGLSILADAEAEAAELHTSASGTLRITMPTGLGVRWLSGLLAQFATDHPRLKIEATYTDQYVDLLAGGLDVAIRAGNLPDSSLIAVKLARIDKQVYASPAYLAAHGTPVHPEELPQHSCLVYAHATGRRDWSFDSATASASVELHPSFVANNGDALVNAAVAGLGLVYVPTFHTSHAIAAGELVRVLEGWKSQINVYAVYPTTHHVPSKVRLLVESLQVSLTNPPWEV